MDLELPDEDEDEGVDEGEGVSATDGRGDMQHCDAAVRGR